MPESRIRKFLGNFAVSSGSQAVHWKRQLLGSCDPLLQLDSPPAKAAKALFYWMAWLQTFDHLRFSSGLPYRLAGGGLQHISTAGAAPLLATTAGGTASVALSVARCGSRWGGGAILGGEAYGPVDGHGV